MFSQLSVILSTWGDPYPMMHWDKQEGVPPLGKIGQEAEPTPPFPPRQEEKGGGSSFAPTVQRF